MPLANLYLFCLRGPVSLFLSELRRAVDPNDIIAISKPRYLYIPASTVDTKILNNRSWDILLLVKSSSSIPEECSSLVRTEYKLTVGVPGRLLASYPQHNAQLVRDAPKIKLTGSLDKALKDRSRSKSKAAGDGGNLELSDDLLRFMERMVADGEGERPMSMLNLLRFHDGGRDSYIKYGQGFKEAGGKRGGDAKVVGAVVHEEGKEKKWDEFSFVHYPSIRHFCDLAAGEDYQEINQKYRVGALKDTFLLCTTETDTLGQWGNIKL